ncbi:porin family protein [Sphingobacterium sp. JB170]|uniref:porin family protein n=1 Tax=Sphingobacterium sp. JB170 TaxID=1434842 RepID=UPI00097EE4EF|nr:porin family protein [Sphingobacterium sp. JB170]SJN22249.1 hypothetical protein FM107_03245 [Sphingobacterium sp. JB170]
MHQNTLPIAALLFVVTIFVHTTAAQTKVGVRAGMNLSGVHLVDEQGDKQETGMIPRFQIGLTVDIPIATDFYIQPAALYSGKGFKQDGGWLASSDSEFKATASYVEVPVNVLYKPQIGNGNLIVGAGPYVAYGTGGKWEADQGQVAIGDIMIEPHGDVIFKNDVADGEFGNYLYGKPWDFGVNFLAGYEFLRKFSVQFNAQFGVSNLRPDVGEAKPDGKLRNTVYGISVGYKL